MSDSILDSTKKVLGLAPDYDEFDQDILMHINSAFSTLEQLGVGPEGGFMIMDNSETWDAILGDDKRLNSVKTYVYLKVRYLFDPPTVGHTLTAMKEQIAEHEWRISVTREYTKAAGIVGGGGSVPPTLPPGSILDGGRA